MKSFFSTKQIIPLRYWMSLLILVSLGSQTSLLAQENSSTSEISYTNAVRFFSPNLDGEKDVLTIPIVITDEGKLVAWRINIYQKTGAGFKEIKVFSLSSEIEGEATSFRNSFLRLFKRNEGVEPPAYVEWNGVSEDNQQMPDGVYYFSYYARDANGNETETDLFPIVIDTVAPESDLVISDNIFSPNGDGRKETLRGTLGNTNFSKQDTLKIAVKDAEGDVVREFDKLGSSARELVWDGNKNNGSEAPEGAYTLEVRATDLAGNETLRTSSPVTLVRAFETSSFSLSLTAISPNGDGFFDTLTIDSSLSSELGLVSWKVDMLNATNKNEVVQYSGESNLKSSILFDGKNAGGKVLPDGLYEAGFVAEFNSGNIIRSERVTFHVDTTAPELRVKALDKFFNPEAAQGGTSTIRIEQEAKGDEEDVYQAVIIDESKEIIYTYPEEIGKVPTTQQWDGKNDNGEIVAGLYRYTLMGEDALSNKASVTSDYFELISEKVNVKVRSALKVFSPNGDGVKDDTEFLLSITETYRRLLKSGSIEIQNGKKRTVASLDFTSYSNKFSWSGQGSKGTPLKEGRYLYRAKIDFSTGEQIITPYGYVYIDLTPPEVLAVVKTPIFSPNADGNLDVFLAANTAKPSKILKDEDTFGVQISRKDGVIVREKEWKGNMPTEIKWTGVSDIGGNSPEGSYTYQVMTRDLAGNTFTSDPLPFELVRTLGELDLELSTEVLSFHPEAKLTNAILTPVLSDTNFFKEIDFQLVSQESITTLAKKNTVEPFDWTRPPANARKNTPLLSTGAYNLRGEATFDSGNVITSEVKPIFLDNTPPTARLKHEPKYFSPDGDDEREILKLRVQSLDNHKLVKSDISIFRRIQFNKAGKAFPQTLEAYRASSTPFKAYHWDGEFDDIISWDGVGDKGDGVESANDYIVFLENEDAVGLRSTNQDVIQVDIFVERLDDGRLRIVINSINFKYDSARMVGDFGDILNRLTLMLSRFPEYQISVLGHTDSRGSDKYNQKLSERRARTVYNTLSSRGVSTQNMEYKGAGESELLIPVEEIEDVSLSPEEKEFLTEENYRRNRRVEFYLERPEDEN